MTSCIVCRYHLFIRIYRTQRLVRISMSTASASSYLPFARFMSPYRAFSHLTCLGSGTARIPAFFSLQTVFHRLPPHRPTFSLDLHNATINTASRPCQARDAENGISDHGASAPVGLSLFNPVSPLGKRISVVSCLSCHVSYVLLKLNFQRDSTC